MIDTSILKEILSLGRRSQSAMQVDNFVMARNGMTVFGVLKQAHREVSDRWESLKELWIKLRTQQIGLAEIHTPSEPVSEMSRLELVRARMAEESLRAQFEDTAKLFLRCYAHAEWARETLIEEHGSLTPQLLDRLDEEEWVLQLRHKLAIEMRQVGFPSEGTIDLISCMHEPARSALFRYADVGNRQAQWPWLCAYDYPRPPANRFTLRVGDLRELVSASVAEQGALLAETKELAIP